MLLSPSVLFGEDEKNVLLINSYHPHFFGTEEMTRGIRDELENVISDDDFFIEYMDYRRNYDDSEYLDRLYDLLSYKYRDRSFSAVIVSDDAGLDFLLERGNSLFPDTPIVFCGINGSPEDLKIPDNMTGIFQATEIKANIDLIRNLHPNLKKLVFVTDRSSFGRSMKDQTETILAESTYNTLSYEIWDDFSFESLTYDLGSLDSDSAVLFLAIVQDNRGEYFSYKYRLPVLCEASSVPVYGMWGITIGKGIVGGRISHPYTHGRETAAMVRKILEGKDPSSFPYPILSSSEFLFDYSLMKRFSMEPEDLPDGSVIINKPDGFYERYKYRILVLTFFILIETALLLYLYFNRSLIGKMNSDLNKKQDQISFIIKEASATLWGFDPEEKVVHFFIRNCFFQDNVHNESTLRLEEYMDLVHPEDRDKLRAAIRRFELPQTQHEGLEYRIQTPKGPFLWVMNRGIREEDGSITGIMLNITDSRQNELIVQRAQKMESIGTLTNGLAHDFNNSLTGIFGVVELLKVDLENHDCSRAPVLKNYIELIENSVRQASELTKDLMNLSRKKSEKFSLVDLKEVCINVMRVFRIGKHKAISVNTDFPEENVMIEGLVSHIEQVILNLLINAAHAIEAKHGKGTHDGEIIIRLFLSDPADTVLTLHNREKSETRYWCLRIEDTGIGMSEELQSRIFEPFFSNKKEKGNGLGLYMCYKIITEHKGYIDVSSRPGEGSSFLIYLPAL